MTSYKKSLDILKKYAQTVSQTSTIDLFFGSESVQNALVQALGSSPELNSILDALKNSGQSGEISFLFSAEPGVGAKVDVSGPVKPDQKSKLLSVLSKSFKAVSSKDLEKVRAEASEKAKKEHAGSGVIPVSFDI